MTERRYFEEFLFSPLPYETEDVKKGHADALTNPTPEEESIFLLVRGFLMYADQHRTDFDSVGKELLAAGKAIQRLLPTAHGRLRENTLNDCIEQVMGTIESETEHRRK